MSDLSTPPPPAELNFTDTPPTSSCGNNNIMPNPLALVIRSSNPTKLKRKLALTFASLYDDELIINNVKTEEKIALASPLWENTEPKIISGNDSEAVKSHLGPRAVEIDEISGNQAKELTPPPEKKATPQTTESIPIDPDTSPTVVTHAGREISNSTTGIASNFEDLGSAVGESSDGIDSNNDFAIRHEWTGTSQFDTVINISIDLQKENQLDNLILYRKALVHDIGQAPYDPYFYIDLSKCDAKLGFADISSHHAYRAIYLLKAGLATVTPQQSELSRFVLTAISIRLCTASIVLILDDLTWMLKSAYRCLVQGVLHCASFQDGLILVDDALERFPEDFELLDLKASLIEAHENRVKEAKEDAKNGEPIDVKSATSGGVIYQKRYPWMSQKLFVRTPRLIRQVNSMFGSLNSEVRPVIFGAPGTASTFKTLSKLPKTADVGPLGIFAKCAIEAGETILFDKSIFCASDVAPSAGFFCDACHAALFPPFYKPWQVFRPSCGCKVSFCSKGCHDIAIGSYHKIQCGVDFSWLYNAGERQTDWCPIMFLRVVGIVLSTPGWSNDSVPQKNPLQHPLLARMTANYASNDKQATKHHGWSYGDNIVAPTRILQDLGIDIFSPAQKTHEGKSKFEANIWSPELIQTIYWRMTNNANTTTMNIARLQQDHLPTPKSNSGQFSRFGQDDNAHLIVLSPNYLFFNHSCRQNVIWTGTVSDGSDQLSFLVAGEGRNQQLMKPGSASVICRANRDIKQGEELTISYTGDSMGNFTEEEYRINPKLAHGIKQNGDISEQRMMIRAMLTKWFDYGRGCGCTKCAEENEREETASRVEK